MSRWSWIGKVGKVWKAGPVARWWNGAGKGGAVMFGSANQIFEKGMTEGAKIAARAGAAAGKATRWARGAYLAVGAGISYWFFRGGLIDATSGALGIPEWAASLIWAVAGLIIVAMVAYMALRWIRARARYVAGGGRRRRW